MAIIVECVACERFCECLLPLTVAFQVIYLEVFVLGCHHWWPRLHEREYRLTVGLQQVKRYWLFISLLNVNFVRLWYVGFMAFARYHLLSRIEFGLGLIIDHVKRFKRWACIWDTGDNLSMHAVFWDGIYVFLEHIHVNRFFMAQTILQGLLLHLRNLPLSKKLLRKLFDRIVVPYKSVLFLKSKLLILLGVDIELTKCVLSFLLLA